MNAAALTFDQDTLIGRVSAVDTSRVFIEVDDHTLLTHVGIGNLVAILGATASEYLIGLVERIRRDIREPVVAPDATEEAPADLSPLQEDTIQVVLVGTYRTVDGRLSNTFKRGADSFPQIERDCYLITARNLQNFMNLLSAGVPEDERLLLGRFVIDRQALAVANGDRFFQRHAAILGSTGCGKSWAVATVVERASKLAHPNLIILDMHGEYGPLATGGEAIAQSFRVAGPGDLDNPAGDCLFLPYWLLNRDEMLSMLVDRSDQNAPNQASRFTTHVRELKQETLVQTGNDKVAATFTVDSPIPYDLEALVARLRDDDTQMVPGASSREKQGEWHGRLSRFIGRLEAKTADRRYGFMFRPCSAAAEYGWLAEMVVGLLESDGPQQPGVKVVDFSEVPSDVLPVVAGVFARLLYDVLFWMDPVKRTPLCIVCDEAHLYLPVRHDADAVERRALETFERIAKEGRKYGVSLLVVSQRPSDVSHTILSQCNNFVIMRLTNHEDQAVVRRLVPDSLAGLTDTMPLLDTGEALLLGDAVLLPTRIKLDAPTREPASATRDFWTEWAQSPPHAEAIAAAVEALRRQSRGV